jgi:cell wall-associated NlpC family hydrolase
MLGCLLALAAWGAPAASAAGSAKDSWARRSIATVLAHGALPGTTVATFGPQQPLDAATLASLTAVVEDAPAPATALHLAGSRSSAASLAAPAGAVTMGGMHRALVHALGLSAAASAVQRALMTAGLAPHGNAGVEVAARTLGLTYNHHDDSLDLFTGNPATRAEAAYSTAQALAAKTEGELPFVRLQLTDLAAYLSAAPPEPPWAAQAVSFIGYPYVWAGSWETRKGPLGVQPHGGFDCSGLVWRVLVLQPGRLSPEQIGGRTTYEMAAATPRSQRLAIDQLRPGDIILFGDDRGPRSPSSAIGHVGISLGGDWFVHSSSQGVTIERLEGGWRRTFAYGRRFAVPGWKTVPATATTSPDTADPSDAAAPATPTAPAAPAEPAQPAPAVPSTPATSGVLALTQASVVQGSTGQQPTLQVEWESDGAVAGASGELRAQAPGEAPIVLATDLAASGGLAVSLPHRLAAAPTFVLTLVTLAGGQELGTTSLTVGVAQ